MKKLERQIVFDSNHPLKISQIIVVNRLSKIGSSNASSASSTLSLDPLNFDSLDPLNVLLGKQEIDPLSRIENESKSAGAVKKSSNIIKKAAVFGEDDDLKTEKTVSWNNWKSAILNKYTTTEKLNFSSSFLINRDISGVGRATNHEHMKHYLEQLDKFEEDDILSLPGLSQQEYVTKIQQLNFNLIECWKSDQRVKALKIAIQCSKLLADTSPLQFYPSKFVLVTDILDIFGRLVYDRLKAKSAAE